MRKTLIEYKVLLNINRLLKSLNNYLALHRGNVMTTNLIKQTINDAVL